MRIIPFDKIATPKHDGYLGWKGHNPKIQVVDSIEDADYVWFSAWGDGDQLRIDIERAALLSKKPVIFVITGDDLYVPDHGDNLYFVTHKNPNSSCFQVQVPYSYHDSLLWLTKGKVKYPDERNWLASFRGSFNTNANRRKLVSLNSDSILIEECDGRQAAQRGDWEVLKIHSDLILNSTFTLCPTGYGPTSIRVSEAIFRGSIPVLLDDDSRWFDHPMDFCVRSTLKYNGIGHIKEALEIAKDEVDERRLMMGRFLCDYLLIDYYNGCKDTIGYSEWIRSTVKCHKQSTS